MAQEPPPRPTQLQERPSSAPLHTFVVFALPRSPLAVLLGTVVLFFGFLYRVEDRGTLGYEGHHGEMGPLEWSVSTLVIGLGVLAVLTQLLFVCLCRARPEIIVHCRRKHG